tara:strand:+ start:603 stop:977 length:375 start_codon:yes stop_codon:yes gene_type:complete
MRRALTITTLCFAWLCANGALWDIAQVFAWGKMVHDYSQTMPLSTAIEKTFDGSAPCEICVVVEDAQQQEPAQKMERSSSDKVLLAYHPTDAVVIEAPTYSWPGAADLIGQLRTELVPVRPPRV